MSVAVRTTAVGVFYDHSQAEKAVAALIQAGFRDDQIGVAVRKETNVVRPDAAPLRGTHAEEGGVAGAITGTVLGGLLGAGAVVAGLIPGLGPVIGAGLLAAAVSGAAAGAVAGGVVGALIGLGIPEEEAHYYQAEFEAGRTIVTVKAGPRYDEVVAILRSHGAFGKGSPLL
jgi:hypothetical protein